MLIRGEIHYLHGYFIYEHLLLRRDSEPHKDKSDARAYLSILFARFLLSYSHPLIYNCEQLERASRSAGRASSSSPRAKSPHGEAPPRAIARDRGIIAAESPGAIIFRAASST